MVIDLFGLTENEVRLKFPAIFQHIADNVKPDRDANPINQSGKTGGYLVDREAR